MRIPNNCLINNIIRDYDETVPCIYEGLSTRVYEASKHILVLTKEYPKILYYKYAIKNSFEHAPKIYEIIEDPINELYIIKRQKLYPITSNNKLVRLEIIKNALKGKHNINDRIVEEILSFYYDMSFDYKLKFDFSPHCFMETKNKKIVVSDLFSVIGT